MNTMYNSHPISPPSLAIVKEWIVNYNLTTVSILEASVIATLAARFGANQELEACIEWFDSEPLILDDDGELLLRAARRPKPQSKAVQAVLDAYRSSHLSVNNLAAAFRTAGNQLSDTTSAHTLYAIADELEGKDAL